MSSFQGEKRSKKLKYLAITLKHQKLQSHQVNLIGARLQYVIIEALGKHNTWVEKE